MNVTEFDKLLLKTAFCCMASDGDIDRREIEMIQSLCRESELFKELDFQEVFNQLVDEINRNGKQFIQDYFDLLGKSDLTEKEELMLIELAIKTIYADEQVEYSEIKFFKNIRYRLRIDDERIVEVFAEVFPDIEMFLEKDIITGSILDKITKEYLDIAELPLFDFIDRGK
ncbi:MAG: TerB family tellurite resistance protein [Tannerellaceae bacterium]|jgi:uncharacterized tellurite resistance protein B-like protein|nr:TerB family tellurite resistance protein [Tannerellaceae bacterium]